MEVRATQFAFRPTAYTAAEVRSLGRFSPGDLIKAIIYEIPTAFNGTSGIEIGTTADPDGFLALSATATTESKLAGGVYHTAASDDAIGQAVPGVGFLFQVAGDVNVTFTHHASATTGYLKGMILYLHTGDRKTVAAAP